jgi:hypothetical protein
MIWLGFTIFTCLLMYESKQYKSYYLFTLICIVIQLAYTAYISYREFGAVMAVVLFVINGMCIDAINFYYGMGAKNKRPIR